MTTRGRLRPRTTTGVLVGVTWRGWFNQLARALGSKPRALAVLAGLGALGLGATAWSTSAMLQSVSGLDLVREAPAAVIGAICCLSTLGALVACLYTPDRTVLVGHLSPLPIRPEALRRATRALELLVGATLALLLTAPVVVQPMVVGSLEQRARSAGVLVAAVVASTVVAVLITRVIESLIGLFPLEAMIARAIAALLVLAGAAWVFLAALPINHNQPHGPAVPMGSALLWSVDSPAGWLVILALGALAWAGWRLSGWWQAGDAASVRRRPRQVSAARAAAGLVALERRQWLRFGPNLVMTLFLNGVALLGLVAVLASPGDQLGLAYLILPVLSAIGVGAYGPTRGVLWMYRVHGRATAWIVPKLIAVLSVWAAMMTLYCATLLVTGTWTITDLAWTLPLLMSEVVVAMAVGVLLPVSAEQSINGSISEAAALGVLIAITVGLQSAVAGVGSLTAAIALQAAVLLGACGTYLLISRTVARA